MVAIIQCIFMTSSIKGTKSSENWLLVSFQRYGLHLTCSKYPDETRRDAVMFGIDNALYRLQRHVALKIVKADFSYENKELDVLLYLSKSRLDHPGKKNVVELLDHFEHQGPNGKHLCLVLPVMLSDGEAMTITSQPRDANFVLSISKQIILGLDFLHKSGLIHCGKILLLSPHRPGTLA